jgi:hypothetical protein
MKSSKILVKVTEGLSDRNIEFQDLCKLLLSLGFRERIKGSHHIFFKDGLAEIINLQALKDGKAKSYQVKQVRNLILQYKLHQEVQNV